MKRKVRNKKKEYRSRAELLTNKSSDKTNNIISAVNSDRGDFQDKDGYFIWPRKQSESET